MENKDLIHVRPTRSDERFNDSDLWFAYFDGGAAGAMAKTAVEAVAKLTGTYSHKPLMMVFTDDQQKRHSKAWSTMSFGGSVHFNFEMTPENMLGNLERFNKHMLGVALSQQAEHAELSRLRSGIRAVGEFIRLASDFSKPVPTGGPR